MREVAQSSSVQAVADAVKKELAEAALRRDSTIYRKPDRLLKRQDLAMVSSNKTYDPDEYVFGITHKI